MKVTLPFGIEYETIDHVERIQMGTVVRWVVKLESGAYLGQRWVSEDTKQFPTYVSRKEAEKALKAYAAKSKKENQLLL